MVRGMKSPGFIRSREQKFPGTNGGNSSLVRRVICPKRIGIGLGLELGLGLASNFGISTNDGQMTLRTNDL